MVNRSSHRPIASTAGRGKYCSRSCKGAAHTRLALAGSAERFWEAVDTRGPILVPELGPCALWFGSRTVAGYGQFSLFGRGEPKVLAHRFAWLLAHGDWPLDCALHHCDNPPCVTAHHLFDGTNAANSTDMVAKRRSTFGERNPQAVLTELDVRWLREARARGSTDRELASTLGVSPATVSLAARGVNWGHV